MAQRFQEMRETDPLLRRLLQEATPELTVLDVGAGTGRYAIPLAKAARSVIAVDSSQAMLAFLRDEARSLGLENLTIVHAPWEEAQVEPCDIVLCSHVIYSVMEIAPFLRKLLEHARAACFMAIRITQFDAPLTELWELVHGEPRKPEPSFIELFNLLYRMGVHANVEVAPFGARGRWSYADLEEALVSCRDLLYLRPQPQRDATIRDYLERRLVVKDGRLSWPGLDMKAATLWWRME